MVICVGSDRVLNKNMLIVCIAILEPIRMRSPEGLRSSPFFFVPPGIVFCALSF